NFGAQLYHRLVHLWFDLLFERDFSAFENFVNMRTELACLRVDDRELLFDSQSERVILHAHGESEMFLKNGTMSCGAPRSDLGRVCMCYRSENVLSCFSIVRTRDDP